MYFTSTSTPHSSLLIPPSDKCDCDSVMFHPDIMDGMGHAWAYNAHGIPPGCMTLSPLSVHTHVVAYGGIEPAPPRKLPSNSLFLLQREELDSSSRELKVFELSSDDLSPVGAGINMVIPDGILHAFRRINSVN